MKVLQCETEDGNSEESFTEEQIVAILLEGDAGAGITELCRKHGVRRSLHRGILTSPKSG
jgi:hypothetical protein